MRKVSGGDGEGDWITKRIGKAKGKGMHGLQRSTRQQQTHCWREGNWRIGMDYLVKT